MNERAWRSDLEAAIENPDARFSVVLDGAELDGALARGRALVEDRNPFAIVNDRQPSAFDIEMHLLNRGSAFDRATFYLNGAQVPNPFT